MVGLAVRREALATKKHKSRRKEEGDSAVQKTCDDEASLRLLAVRFLTRAMRRFATKCGAPAMETTILFLA
jgi:hypothetical protein